MTYEFKKEVSTTPGNSTRSKRDISCYVFRWTVLSWSDDGEESGRLMVKTLEPVTADSVWELCESTSLSKVILPVHADYADGKEPIRD